MFMYLPSPSTGTRSSSFLKFLQNIGTILPGCIVLPEVLCYACWALTNLTFREPCIMIYSYNKSQ